MHDSVAPPLASTSALPRTLGLGALWLLIVNGMIGAGIFGIPAEAARLAGAFSPLLFLLTAVLIAPVMLCFAELASATRESGGPARYVRVAFGPMAGFQTGWALYVARLTALAANFNLLVSALAHFWPGLGEGLPRVLMLAALSALLALLNIVGVRAAVRSIGVLTAGKLFPIALLALLGVWQWAQIAQPVLTPSLLPDASAQSGAAVLLMIYAYVGFESGLIPGGEARAPQRDMPRALLASLLICGVLYALMQSVCLALLPDLAQTDRPLVALGALLLGPFGAGFVLIAIVFSVGGNLLGSVFSVPRISHAMARDGELPAAFGSVSARFGTPVFSIAFYSTLGWALAATGSFVLLAALSVLVRLLIYLACVAAVPAVRRQASDDSWRLRGGPILPTLAVAFCLGLLTQVSRESVFATIVLLGCGSALYLLAQRRRRR